MNVSSVSSKISDLVSMFVTEVTRLANQAALETLQSAFGSGNAVESKPGRVKAAPEADASPNRGNGQGGAKRTPEQLAELRSTLLDHIKSNPGQRIEEINKVLGTTTGQLSRPIRSLIDDKEVRSEGHLRSTRYYATGDGKAKKAKATSKAKAPKKAAPKKAAPKKAPKPKAPKKDAADTGSSGGSSKPGIEKDVLEAALATAKGNISAAAKELGKSPSATRRAIKRHGLLVKE